jgi:PLP dependent protein
MSGRREELRSNLERAQARVALACQAAGRPVDEVTIVAVTKTWPSSDIRHLAALGVRDIGENKDQEGRSKWSDLVDSEFSLTWHFLGQIQRNKATRIGQWADVIHSVDRVEILDPLIRSERPLDVLIQVNLDPQPGRGGVQPAGIDQLAQAIASRPALALRGLMVVPPQSTEPRAAFEEIQRLHQRLLLSHPEARWLSAGMSGDVEEAIACGATHVRLGTSILGSRY